MQNHGSVELKRDCEATEIPSGTVTTLPAGTPVDIKQTLGGSYTVRALSAGLFRIASRDADALGLQSDAASAKTAKPPPVPVHQKLICVHRCTCCDTGIH